MKVTLTMQPRPLTAPDLRSTRVIENVVKIDERSTWNQTWRVFITEPEGQTEWWDKAIILEEKIE